MVPKKQCGLLPVLPSYKVDPNQKRQNKLTSVAVGPNLSISKVLQEGERTTGTPGSFAREKWLQSYLTCLLKMVWTNLSLIQEVSFQR